MFNHRVYIIKFRYHQQLGHWEPHDDFRSAGYSKQWTEQTYSVLASSEEVARAHFAAKGGFPNESQMEIIGVEELKVDATLLELHLS